MFTNSDELLYSGSTLVCLPTVMNYYDPVELSVFAYNDRLSYLGRTWGFTTKDKLYIGRTCGFAIENELYIYIHWQNLRVCLTLMKYCMPVELVFT